MNAIPHTHTIISPRFHQRKGQSMKNPTKLHESKRIPDPDPRQFSLSFVVTFWTAAAIALCMAFYAVVQHQLHPELTATQLLVHHLWHVLALGAVVYLTLWLGFRRFLWQPLMRVFLHLYGVGKGHLQPLRVRSRIRELATIADGINLMIWRIGREIDPEAIEHASGSLADLRRLLAPLTGENPDLFNEISRHLEKIEQSLITLAQRTSESPPALAA